MRNNEEGFIEKLELETVAFGYGVCCVLLEISTLFAFSLIVLNLIWCIFLP